MPIKNEVYTLDDVFNESLAVKIYGRPFAPQISVPAGPNKSVGQGKEALAFVSVRGFAFGSICRRLPVPLLLALPGEGVPPEPDDKCATKGEQVWTVPFNATSTALMPSSGTIEDLLADAETKGISGGLRLENPRLENGKACVDVHAWAKITILGHKVEFDERFPICVEGCKTVWDIGWARIEACYNPPKKICAKLCVGRWGLEKCWDFCVEIPIPEPDGVAPSSCGCK
jgi:hypothetical protein